MNKTLLLGVIFLLAFLLRTVNLGTVPAGFTADEASQGYSAFSLLHTGKDEWGAPWPLTSFRAFADYRAPLQTYLIIPSIAIFGLNEFAVRLPSALFGSLAVLVVFFLAQEIYKLIPTHKQKSPELVGFLAAFFLAISPWHLQFSRMALEANFSSFFFTGGLLFFLLGLSKPRLLLLSAFFFGIDLYSYLAAKVFLPLFLAGLIITFWDRLSNVRIRSVVALSFLVFSVISLPIYLDTFFGPGNVRGQDLIITNFSRENLSEISNVQYYSPLNKLHPALSRVFENKAIFAWNKFVQNYLSYLSPAFWFAESGRETSYAIIPGRGLFYLWMLPLLFIGFYFLIKNRSSATKIVLLWLLIGIIPAAITKEGYRPNRAGSLLSLFEIVSAFGFIYLTDLFAFIRTRAVKLFFGAVIGLSAVFYLVELFYFWPIKYPDAMAYGYRQLIPAINRHPSNIVVIDKGGESHIFVAFYNQLSPSIFQSYSAAWWQNVLDNRLLFVDMQERYKLDRYLFKTFDRSVDLVPGQTVVLPSKKLTDDLKPFVVDTVTFLNEEPAFYLLQNDKK